MSSRISESMAITSIPGELELTGTSSRTRFIINEPYERFLVLSSYFHFIAALHIFNLVEFVQFTYVFFVALTISKIK